jgi:transcriptional regulator with XRE-family HTH domain
MISANAKCKFLDILTTAKELRVQNFTQKEISEMLCVSRSKLINFEKGLIFDFWMLEQYCAISGIELEFNIIEK